MTPDEERSDVIAERVTAYLHDHPKAADSIEGVMEWWLKMSPYDVSKEEVRKALDKLLGEGVIKIRTLADGTEIYSLKFE